jgi:hypothetical protein
MKVPSMLCMFLTLIAVSVRGDEQLRLAVSPAQSLAPSNLRIRVRVVPHADNRSLEIVAESGEFYRSSRISLEGERAPVTNMFEFRGLPGGEYLVSSVLTDSRGHRRAIAEQQIRVIPQVGR